MPAMATEGAAPRIPANRLGFSASDSAAKVSTSAPPHNAFASTETTATCMAPVVPRQFTSEPDTQAGGGRGSVPGGQDEPEAASGSNSPTTTRQRAARTM